MMDADNNQPNNTHRAAVPRETGIVKWYNETKGYGFIEQPNGRDLFVHFREVKGKLNRGDKVEYRIGEGRKGPCATQVRVIEAAPPEEQSP